MAIQSTVNSHEVRSMTNIHKHMELVCNSMLDTEHDFVERGYVITWQGVTTYVGLHGTMDGFSTRLNYSVALEPPTTKPKERKK